MRVLGEVEADLAVLPRNAFGFEGERTLDDWTVADLERESGVPVVLGRTAADLVHLSTGALPIRST